MVRTMTQDLQIRGQILDEGKLSQSFYFQSLLQEVMEQKLLSETQIMRIQMELIELMGKEVARYTNEESSSVPVEKAQELLQSITYSIGFYLKAIQSSTKKLELLQNEKIQALFYKGMEEIERRKKEAHVLLSQIQKNALKLKNIAYQDTIHPGLSEFFHDYNTEYGAHQLCGCIDYPILYPITEYLGLEYMEAYLNRIAIEEAFLGRFQTDRINLLLQDFDQEAEHMLLNIYELVLMNVLGCKILDRDIYELELDSTETTWLQNKLQKLSEKELLLKFETAFTEIGEELQLNDEELSYGRNSLNQAAIRLSQCLKLNTLTKFFMTSQERGIFETVSFEDGIRMENDILRELMIKIAESSTVKGKVALIKSEVHSLDDLTEILDACFTDEEYTDVFSFFNEEELAVLKKYILYDLGGIEVKDYDTEKQWQRVLLKL